MFKFAIALVLVCLMFSSVNAQQPVRSVLQGAACVSGRVVAVPVNVVSNVLERQPVRRVLSVPVQLTGRVLQRQPVRSVTRRVVSLPVRVFENRPVRSFLSRLSCR